MNSPTIAAVVPGLKPQAGRPAASETSETAQGGSFANVLAGQAAPSQGAEGHGQTTPSGDAATDKLAANDPESGKARAPASEEADKSQAEADELLASLPQIALEIALHARDQAARGKSAPADADRELRVRDLRVDARAPDLRHASPDKSAMTAAMRADASAAQADTIKDRPAADDAKNALDAKTLFGMTSVPATAAASAAQTHPGRAARHQTDIGSNSHAPLASLNKTAPAAALANAAAPAQRDPADVAFAAARDILAPGEPAEHGIRPAPAAELAAASPGSSAGLNPFTLATASAGPANSPAIATPMHQPGWNADFGRQVVMLARDAHSGMQTAELRLDPPELGPLRISLSLNEGMASALFVSAHASVRQAIESALPQLSQQLAQAGISLGETHVGDQGQAGFGANEGNAQAGAHASGGGQAHAGGAIATDATTRSRPVAADALVDTFA